MRKSPAELLFDGGRKDNIVGLCIIACITILLLLSVGPITKYVKGFGKQKNTEKIYMAGTYEGVAKGFAGDIVTSITVSETEIEKIKIVGENESPDIGGKAMIVVEAAVIEKQNSDIDMIAGATVTTEAIKKSLDIALAKAKGEEYIEETEEVSEKEDAVSAPTQVEEVVITAKPKVQGSFVDGEYDKEVQGHNGLIKLKIIVEDSNIVSIEFIEHQETAGIYEKAVEGVVTAIIEGQSLDVDTVSGATVTSNAILQAIKEAVPVK